MKNRLFLICFILIFCVCLFSCSKSDKSSTSAPTSTSSSKTSSSKTTTTSTNSSSDNVSIPTGDDYDNMMNALSSLSSKDERLGREYFKFPKVTKWSELPSSSVWSEMGMIDLTPDTYENGMIYDSGDTIIDGLWNGYSYECKSNKETFNTLIQKIWDSGYRGVPIGNGTIAEAGSIDDLRRDNDFYAFYTYDDWTLCVSVRFLEWSQKIIAGVYDATTMLKDFPELTVYPSINWSVTKSSAPNGGLDYIGTDLHGIWTEDEKLIYAYNVTWDMFQSYMDKLERRTDISAELYDSGETWEEWYFYYSDGGFWIYYNESAGMINWGWW